MKIQTLAALLVAGMGTSAFADMPDGRGGRTAPQASRVEARHAESHRMCCRDAAALAAAKDVVGSPAELKARGHLAWVSRGDEPIPMLACCKRHASVQQEYASPAERKALGHLGTRDSKTIRATVDSDSHTCC